MPHEESLLLEHRRIKEQQDKRATQHLISAFIDQKGQFNSASAPMRSDADGCRWLINDGF